MSSFINRESYSIGRNKLFLDLDPNSLKITIRGPYTSRFFTSSFILFQILIFPLFFINPIFAGISFILLLLTPIISHLYDQKFVEPRSKEIYFKKIKLDKFIIPIGVDYPPNKSNIFNGDIIVSSFFEPLSEEDLLASLDERKSFEYIHCLKEKDNRIIPFLPLKHFKEVEIWKSAAILKKIFKENLTNLDLKYKHYRFEHGFVYITRNLV